MSLCMARPTTCLGFEAGAPPGDRPTMKLLRSVLTALTALALPTFGLASRAAAQEVDGEVLYKKVVKSCVFIVTPVKGGYGMGSGSLIDADKRLVLTNFHVVDEENIVFVQFPTFMK